MEEKISVEDSMNLERFKKIIEVEPELFDRIFSKEELKKIKLKDWHNVKITFFNGIIESVEIKDENLATKIVQFITKKIEDITVLYEASIIIKDKKTEEKKEENIFSYGIEGRGDREDFFREALLRNEDLLSATQKYPYYKEMKKKLEEYRASLKVAISEIIQHREKFERIQDEIEKLNFRLKNEELYENERKSLEEEKIKKEKLNLINIGKKGPGLILSVVPGGIGSVAGALEKQRIDMQRKAFFQENIIIYEIIINLLTDKNIRFIALNEASDFDPFSKERETGITRFLKIRNLLEKKALEIYKEREKEAKEDKKIETDKSEPKLKFKEKVVKGAKKVKQKVNKFTGKVTEIQLMIDRGFKNGKEEYIVKEVFSQSTKTKSLVKHAGKIMDSKERPTSAFTDLKNTRKEIEKLKQERITLREVRNMLAEHEKKLMKQFEAFEKQRLDPEKEEQAFKEERSSTENRQSVKESTLPFIRSKTTQYFNQLLNNTSSLPKGGLPKILHRPKYLKTSKSIPEEKIELTSKEKREFEELKKKYLMEKLRKKKKSSVDVSRVLVEKTPAQKTLLSVEGKYTDQLKQRRRDEMEKKEKEITLPG